MTDSVCLFPGIARTRGAQVPIWTRAPQTANLVSAQAIPRSSMAEHPTVNRTVVGSSPTAGASHRQRHSAVGGFLVNATILFLSKIRMWG